MKHKKILLVIAFLTLFVFQQVQAGGNMPSAVNAGTHQIICRL